MERSAPASFAQLVREHQAAVRAYVGRYLKRRVEADDLAQEVFLGVHRSLPSYRGEASMRLWVLGVARRQVAIYLRREMRRLGHERQELAEAVARWQADRLDAEDLGLADQDREVLALQACLEALPADTSELVAAYYFRAESAVEIARRLGKKESAVRMALLRIRQGLRACVESRMRAGA